MATDPSILLTNDDGIDSPALWAIADALDNVGAVTVVAPTDNKSGVGRARSSPVDVTRGDRGYAVDGTPAACVVFGLRGLAESFDLVVSGCNLGPNAGGYVLGRSGTVGAAVEAGFLGTPGIAVSAYHPTDLGTYDPDALDFDIAADATRYLAREFLARPVTEQVDVLNVNVPSEGDPEMRMTEPYADYEAVVDHDDENGRAHLRDDWWALAPDDEHTHTALVDRRDQYPENSDRGAIIDGDISVSPLRAPHEVHIHPIVDDVVEEYDGP